MNLWNENNCVSSLFDKKKWPCTKSQFLEAKIFGVEIVTYDDIDRMRVTSYLYNEKIYIADFRPATEQELRRVKAACGKGE